jgi:transketolase
VRGTFARTLTELADRDSRILLLTGDVGYLALEPFVDKHPGRFFNVGVAEQNMVGLATGLAEAGFIPFVYSIAPFAVLRPYEFIRNGPIQHHSAVRIVGVGAGMEYSLNGPSHYSLEDVAVMRAQPGITVIAPADHEQARSALLASWNLPGPIYYRLGKDDQTVLAGLGGRFELGRAQQLRQGSDVVIVALGALAVEASAAAEQLAKQGISCCVLAVASVVPAPVDDLRQALSRFPVMVTVEAHYLSGGLGSIVAELAAEGRFRARLTRIAVKTRIQGACGTQAYLYHQHGLSCQALADTVRRELAEGNS